MKIEIPNAASVIVLYKTHWIILELILQNELESQTYCQNRVIDSTVLVKILLVNFAIIRKYTMLLFSRELIFCVPFPVLAFDPLI